MTRHEFIENLKNNLSSLDSTLVKEKVDYYNDYIDTEVKNGKSESDVIKELGDPRLIAKTIKEVSDDDDAVFDDNNNTYSEEKDNFNKRYSEGESNYNRNRMPYVYSTDGIGCVIIGLIIFIVIYGILSFLGRVAVGSVKFMVASPIAFVAIVGLIYYLFINRK